MRDDPLRLHDILRAIELVLSETIAGRVAFDRDAKLQVWVLYHLETIGEACRGLSPEFRARFPDPVWSKATGLRNVLAHHYFEIDLDLVWKVVENELHPLRETVERALLELRSR